MKKMFCIEWKLSTRKIFLVVCITFYVFALIFLQLGIEKYKGKVENRERFVNIEQTKLTRYESYFKYFIYGLRMMSEPSPLISMFYNSIPFSDSIGDINDGTEAKLVRPQVGNCIFDQSSGGLLDLSWYLLLVGSILALSWGFGSFRNTELIKFMLNFTHLRSIYLGIVLARVLLIILVIAILGVIIWAQFLLNGISLQGNDLMNLFLFIFLTAIAMITFLLIGSVLGVIKDKLKAVIVLFIVWLGLAWVWPEIMYSIFSNSALKNIDHNYVHEERMLKIVLELEKRMTDHFQKEKKLETEFIVDNIKSDYKKIEDLEYEMIDKTKEIAGRLHFWSIFNPVTFYKSVNNELSSMGYGGYTAFYEEVIQKQKAFVDFYIKKRFYEKSQKVEPFLAGDEYIFKARGSLPRYFALGLALNLFYLLVALFLGFQGLKKAIYQKPEKLEHFKDIDLKLLSGGKHFVYIFLQQAENFAQQVYNALSGQVRHFTGKISIDGNLTAQGQRKNFIYLPNPNVIPDDIQTADLLGLSGLPKTELNKIKEKLGEVLEKPFSDLEKFEKLDVLLRMVKPRKAEIYLIYDFLATIDEKHIRKAIKELKGKDNLVIELSSRPQYLDDDLFQISTIFFEKRSGYSEDRRHK